MLANTDLARLVMPLAIGLLIGLERGWQQRDARPGSRVAGLRTFGLFGLIGGLAGFVAGTAGGQGIDGGSDGGWAVSAVLLLAGCALVLIGYRRDSSPSATTEAAALVTLGLVGWPATASRCRRWRSRWSRRSCCRSERGCTPGSMG
jgi:peptidoglycan/LPS O-acetylase OafA/YrhL